MSFNDLNRAYEISQERRYQEQAEEEDIREYWDNVQGAIEHLRKAKGKLFDNRLMSMTVDITVIISELEAMKEVRR